MSAKPSTFIPTQFRLMNMLAHLKEELFWSLGVCYLRHSRVLQRGSGCLMNLLYRQNQGRAGNKIKKLVWDCNNSSSGCRVSPLEAIAERKLLLLWKYNDFLLQISKKKLRQVSAKGNSIFTAGGRTLRNLSCVCSRFFSVFLLSPCLSLLYVCRSKPPNLKCLYITHLHIISREINLVWLLK